MGHPLNRSFYPNTKKELKRRYYHAKMDASTGLQLHRRPSPFVTLAPPTRHTHTTTHHDDVSARCVFQLCESEREGAGCSTSAWQLGGRRRRWAEARQLAAWSRFMEILMDVIRTCRTITALLTAFAMQSQPSPWGEWMGAWKSGSEVDKEAERIDRQKAAVGGETVSQLKDLNVLIIGCRAVGTETAKNLILSNVGAIGVHDDAICCTRDMGANCYISSEAVSSSRSRSAAILPHLKSLNPFCKVDIFPSIDDSAILTKNFLGTNRPISTLVLTVFLPKVEVIRMNDACRKANIAFVFAVNTGVTSLIFSDFGPNHTITDKNGNPIQVSPFSSCCIVFAHTSASGNSYRGS